MRFDIIRKYLYTFKKLTNKGSADENHVEFHQVTCLLLPERAKSEVYNRKCEAHGKIPVYLFRVNTCELGLDNIFCPFIKQNPTFRIRFTMMASIHSQTSIPYQLDDMIEY